MRIPDRKYGRLCLILSTTEKKKKEKEKEKEIAQTYFSEDISRRKWYRTES